MGTNNVQGWIIPGSDGDRSFELNRNQCDDLYRVFCHLFWKKATHEYLDQNGSASLIDGSPVGDISLNHQYNLPEKLSATAIKDVDDLKFGSVQYWSKNLLWNFLPFKKAEGSFLLHLSESKHLQSIEELCSKTNVNVRFTTRSLQNTLLTSNAGWSFPDIPDTAKVNWAMRINSDQRNNLLNLMNNEWQSADWELKRNLSLGELAGIVRFAEEPGKVFNISKFVSMDLEPIEAPSMDVFLEPDFEHLFADQTQFDKDRLAHLIEYNVKLYPPFLPDNAKPDPLIQQWKSKQNQWAEKISLIEGKLNGLEKYENSLSEKIKVKLSKLLVAQKQKVSEFKIKLNELKNVDLGRSSPSHLKEWTNELLELESEIEKRISKNKIQEVETRKEIDWENQCKTLNDKISASEDNLSRKEAELAISENKTKEIEENLKQKLDKKQEKNLKKELDKSKKRENMTRSALDKLKIEQSKLRSQRQNLGDRFVPQNDLSDKGDEAFGRVLGNKQFEESFVFEWGNEFLPLEGMELYSYDSKRWLVIEDLEQIREAKHHASVLNAEICAKRGD